MRLSLLFNVSTFKEQALATLVYSSVRLSLRCFVNVVYVILRDISTYNGRVIKESSRLSLNYNNVLNNDALSSETEEEKHPDARE